MLSNEPPHLIRYEALDNGHIRGLAFSRRVLVSASLSENGITIHSPLDGRKITTLPTKPSGYFLPLALFDTDDDTTLLGTYCEAPYRIEIYRNKNPENSEWELVDTISDANATPSFPHTATGNGACFHPSTSNELAVACQDGKCVIWDLPKKTARLELVGSHIQSLTQARSGKASCCYYSPSGKRIAVGYVSCAIAIFDCESGNELLNVTLGDECNDLKFFREDRILYVCDNKKISIINANNGTELATTKNSNICMGCSISPDGVIVAVGGLSRRVDFYFADTMLQALPSFEQEKHIPQLRPIESDDVLSHEVPLGSGAKNDPGWTCRVLFSPSGDGTLAIGADNPAVFMLMLNLAEKRWQSRKSIVLARNFSGNRFFDAFSVYRIFFLTAKFTPTSLLSSHKSK